MVLLAQPAQAQIKKCWDFTKGFSEETQNDLKADTENWATNASDSEGNPTAWKDAKKLSGVLTANGNVIQELLGLSLGTTGLSNGNNIHLGPNKIRVTRANMQINFPKLANGQKLTVVARSANSTATDRGFAAKYDYMKYIEGPADGICLGGAGDQTLVWQIETDGTDSVDVAIVTSPNGGLDVSMFMIDNGDEPDLPEDLRIAYLYASNYTNYCGIDNDPIYNETKIAEQQPEAIDIKDFTAADTDTLAALEGYDIVVISEAIDGKSAFGKMLVQLVNRVPVINFKSFFYASGRWGVGSGVNPTTAKNDGGIATISVPSAYLEDELFTDVVFEDDSLVTLFNNYDPETIKSNLVQAYTADSDGLFGSDEVIAQVYNGETAYNAIHRHGTKNTYILLPISSDAMYLEGETNLSESAYLIINNAIDLAYASKGSVVACNTPTISQDNGDKVTTVTIKCGTSGATIYYTLDGTEPTTASTLYEAPFDVTADSTQVKALAVKQGNNPSAVATALVRVYEKPAAPVFAFEQSEGKTIVSLTAQEGATIYYGYIESTDATKFATYSEPVEVTRPVTMYAYAQAGVVVSELASAQIEVAGVDSASLRNNEFARFDANKDDWYWETTGGSSKVAYYMGKSAVSMYTSIDTIANGADTTYVKHEREPYVFYAKNDSVNASDNGWKLYTMGQEIHWESQAPNQQVGKSGDAAYNCDKAEDLLLPATSGFINFGACYGDEGFNAAIQSTRKFQGPFDLVACVGNNNSDGASLKLALAVSEDGETWLPLDTVGVSHYKRFWTTHRIAYNEAKEVYVRAMQGGGGTKLAVYDLILFNDEEPVALRSVADSEVVSLEYFDLNGRRMAAPLQQGVTLVRSLHRDGSIKVEKLLLH